MELGYKFTTAKPDEKIEPVNLTEQSAKRCNGQQHTCYLTPKSCQIIQITAKTVSSKTTGSSPLPPIIDIRPLLLIE